jgi:hypothetical protein
VTAQRRERRGGGPESKDPIRRQLGRECDHLRERNRRLSDERRDLEDEVDFLKTIIRTLSKFLDAVDLSRLLEGYGKKKR